ncbi:MAG: hypothetical protein KC619_03585 [Myxococcales bacterium]|nr:hypothetical protein [Myxococcales bacterium]
MDRPIAALLVALLATSGCYRSHRREAPDASAPDAGRDAHVVAMPDVDAGTDGGRPTGWIRPDAGPDEPPVAPPEGTVAVALAAGGDHVCALADDDAVYCWGWNGVGQCAHGAGITVGTPTRVRGLPPIAAIDSSNNHTCAIGRDGSLWCWGFSYYGQLGVPEAAIGDCGAADCSRVPLRVDIDPVDALYVGTHGTCARTLDGVVHCWGRDPAAGAVRAAGIDVVDDLDLGQLHACALVAGELRCVGESDFGRLGDGERGDGRVRIDGVQSFEVGSEHACAIDAADRVLCWGYNWAGSLGRKGDLPYCMYGDTGGECAIEPVPPYGSPLAAAVSIGEERTCLLGLDGEVACWGAWTVAGSVSYCGGRPGECDHVITTVEGLEDVVSIDVGASMACAIEATGAVRCWGWSGLRQLGDGRLDDTLNERPVRVIGFGR